MFGLCGSIKLAHKAQLSVCDPIIIIHFSCFPQAHTHHLLSCLVFWWHWGRRGSSGRRLRCHSLHCTCSPAAAIFRKAKVVFCLTGREEVGCFHLVVWYPKKALSTWCLIIVMTGAGPPKAFQLYPRLHDLIKHNSEPITVINNLIWHFVAVPTVWCAFFTGLKRPDRSKSFL